MHLEIQKEGNALLIFVENTLWKKAYFPYFKQHVQSIKRCQDIQSLEETFKKSEEQAVKDAALKLLSLQPLFVKELITKLKLRFFSDESIELAVSYCKRCGYLADEELKDLKVRAYLDRGYGSMKIKSKLHFVLKEEEIANALHKEENRELENLVKILEKHAKKAPLLDNKEKQKLIAKLSRRGYTIAHILDGMKLVFKG